MSQGGRIPTDGGAGPLGQNPFAALSGAGLPSQPPPPVTLSGASTSPASTPKKNRGRVDIRRETQGRGGKTVTVVSGFLGISQAEKEDLAKKIQKAAGAGGTVKEGRIEIQGDKRDAAARVLEAAGFRPVMAGG